MTGGQEDRREVGRGGKLGGTTGQERSQFALASRTEGGEERIFFFPPPCGVACCRSRWPDMGDGRS